MKEKILVLSAGEPWSMEGNQGFGLEWVFEGDIDSETGFIKNEATINDVTLRAEFTELPGYYEAELMRKQVKQSNGKKIAMLVPKAVELIAPYDFTFPKKAQK
jgi:hypothetical protein